ncbi:MAG: short-chain dehydrogenase/reductase, partial [Catalinimonas sp.]
KFALEGIGEALAGDVRPLGIWVTNVEPGPFRTDWAGRSATYTESRIDDYADTAARNAGAIRGVSGQQVGDPARGAAAMWALTRLDEPPVHLPLGEAAYKRVYKKLDELRAEVERYEHLGRPTDFPADEA